jgi:hypothetical protein
MPRMPRMNDEMLDRMLASEEELIPSSGFAASVMERIREEAAASPPIPFPWKRAIPGIALTAVVFGGGVVELSRGAIAAAHDGPHLSLIGSPGALRKHRLGRPRARPLARLVDGVALDDRRLTPLAGTRRSGSRENSRLNRAMPGFPIADRRSPLE